jgi:hypothetical protein
MAHLAGGILAGPSAACLQREAEAIPGEGA